MEVSEVSNVLQSSTSWALVRRRYAGIERKQEDCYCAAWSSAVNVQTNVWLPLLAHAHARQFAIDCTQAMGSTGAIQALHLRDQPLPCLRLCVLA